MKTRMTIPSKHPFGRRGFTALLLALACAGPAGSCIAATAPTAEDLCVAAVSTLSIPVVLKASDPNGLPLTFSVVSHPLHGTLSGTAPNLVYTSSGNFAGVDGLRYVVSNGQATSTPATVTIVVKHGLSINNVSVTEGNSGTRAATFTVTRTGLGCEEVFFRASTRDGTARAASDYEQRAFVITFSPSASSVSLSVPVIGETRFEFNESFFLELADPSFNAVIINGTGRGTILNDDFPVATLGIAALTPDDSVVGVGERVNLSLAWTHPVGWRQLDSVDLLLVDDEGESLVVRWHEAENSFSLLNPTADTFDRTAEAGSRTRFETSAVTLYLHESTGGGLPGQTVTIDYSLSFKPPAAGRTFNVEVAATDDAGNQQGFEPVGTITLLPR